MSWKWYELASLVSVLESGSRPKGGASTESGEILSLGGENILRSGGVTLNEVKRVPKKFYEKMTKGHLLDADVLINKDGAQTGKVGLYAQLNSPPSCINEHLFLIRGNPQKITQEYLYYILLSQPSQNQIDAQISGSAQPGLKSDFLCGVFTKIPDTLSEQIKIAEILSTVDQAIDQTEALIAKQQRIKNGLMQDLLTRGIDEDGNLRSEDTHEFKDSPLGRIPVEWKVERIEQKLDRIIDYRGRTPTKVEAGVPLLTAKNVRNGYIDEEPREFIAESAFNSWMTRGIPKPGDVLFTTEAPMGNVALVPEYRIALAQRLLTLCPKPNELSQDYLFWLLHWRHSTERLELLTSGSTVVGVKQSVFRKVVFSFPRIEEQRHISVILNSLNSASENQRNKLTKLRSIKTALLQDLLTGKVSVTPLLTEAGISI